MNNQFDFIELQEELLEACVDLYVETFSSEPWNDVYESKEPVTDFFNKHFQNNYFIGYVMLHENKPIALSIGFQKPWIEGMEYYIDQFCVHPSFQGNGIGTQFLQLISNDIKEKGMNAIMLNTERGFPSERFYIKNDFIPLVEIITLAKMV